jgi:hypothetical protein
MQPIAGLDIARIDRNARDNTRGLTQNHFAAKAQLSCF